MKIGIIEKIIEENKRTISVEIRSLKSKRADFPTMRIAYRSLRSGIEPYELRDPEFYGVPDEPYEIRHSSRTGFILDVFDRAGEHTVDGGTIVADLSRYCVVFDIPLVGIYHASFIGNKEQPVPIWEEIAAGYGSWNPRDWITHYEKIRERLGI